MTSSVRSYRDLIAWQRAVELAEATYTLTRAFPREELFGLTSQMRRAAVSIASNIAEGYGRDSLATYLNFLRIARGSLRELETQLIIADRVRLADPVAISDVLNICNEQGRILHALITKLEVNR